MKSETETITATTIEVASDSERQARPKSKSQNSSFHYNNQSVAFDPVSNEFTYVSLISKRTSSSFLTIFFLFRFS